MYLKDYPYLEKVWSYSAHIEIDTVQYMSMRPQENQRPQVTPVVDEELEAVVPRGEEGDDCRVPAVAIGRMAAGFLLLSSACPAPP